MGSIQEYGAPLGWEPKSKITWNNHFLPYALRWDDMRFDLGLGLRYDFWVVEVDMITGATREWESYQAAEQFYGQTRGALPERMRKNILLNGTKFFHLRDNPPKPDRLRRLKRIALIACSFDPSKTG